jgi:predicted nucleotidyltransferase
MANQRLRKENILRSIRESSAKLSAWGVTSIGLFGSFARGDASSDSDVDILVEFGPDERTFDNFMETCFFLEELLGRKIELVTTDSISPYIKPHVLKEVEYVPLSS